jgi:hypothetical protein
LEDEIKFKGELKMQSTLFRALSILSLLMTTPAFAGPKEEAYAVIEKWAAGFNAFDAEQTPQHILQMQSSLPLSGNNLPPAAQRLPPILKL